MPEPSEREIDQFPTVSETEKFVLNYFKTIDLAVGDQKPDKNGNIKVLFYKKGEDQPAINIVRHISNYRDGSKGLQDEIMLFLNESRLELNGEKNPQGEYLNYPTSLRPTSLEYLERAVATLSECMNTEGSRIIIDNRTKFTAKAGTWIPSEIDIDKISNPETRQRIIESARSRWQNPRT